MPMRIHLSALPVRRHRPADRGGGDAEFDIRSLAASEVPTEGAQCSGQPSGGHGRLDSAHGLQDAGVGCGIVRGVALHGSIVRRVV